MLDDELVRNLNICLPKSVACVDEAFGQSMTAKEGEENEKDGHDDVEDEDDDGDQEDQDDEKDEGDEVGKAGCWLGWLAACLPACLAVRLAEAGWLAG